MASFATLHGLNDSLFRSQFLGQDHHLTHHHFPLKHSPLTLHQRKPTSEVVQLRAKFNILEMMGGRGLCNGEKGVEQELKRQVVDEQPPTTSSSSKDEEKLGDDDDDGSVGVPEDAFEKEMMGLTGGFPGGEKGLKKFIEENPPSKPPNLLTTTLSL
ncbi:hypothetical protein VNO77_20912 [Canavalia gladiata]|uniref:Uncharacterized protein n=1 Tax=Canavalia gladiata TaxID=3824 RepID=A0AAN9LQD8_CANGL